MAHTAEWLPVSIGPPDADLEVCIVGFDGNVHALMYPCLRNGTDGSMPQIRSRSTFSRRIGANGPRHIENGEARLPLSLRKRRWRKQSSSRKKAQEARSVTHVTLRSAV